MASGNSYSCKSTGTSSFFNTCIAIGGVFGVGFLREALDMSEKKLCSDIRERNLKT